MKLKFKAQSFQTAAVTAAVDLLRGQNKRRDTFTITNDQLVLEGFNLGYSNALTLADYR